MVSWEEGAWGSSRRSVPGQAVWVRGRIGALSLGALYVGDSSVGQMQDKMSIVNNSLHLGARIIRLRVLKYTFPISLFFESGMMVYILILAMPG